MEQLYTEKIAPNPSESLYDSLGVAIQTLVKETKVALFYGISSVRDYKVSRGLLLMDFDVILYMYVQCVCVFTVIEKEKHNKFRVFFY